MKYSLMPKMPVARQAAEIDHSEALDIVREQIAELGLDLSGLVVVAGAAAGYQAAIATAAALAGASRVITFIRESGRHPNATEAARATLAFAKHANVAARLEIVTRIDRREWQDIDILVNGFQVGPISRSIVELLPSHAVIALMAEPWELRPGIVDIDACADVGIRVVAPNLGHPAIMLLPELARLCCMLIGDTGIDPRDASFAVLCDTPCGPFIERALSESGARVKIFPHPLLLTSEAWDAVIVAMRPSDRPSMDINGLGRIFENARQAPLVQFSGEIDRLAAGYFGLRVWPPRKPGRGQLGLPLDALGPAPAIRKLTGGLKAAEAVYRGAEIKPDSVGWIVRGGGQTKDHNHQSWHARASYPRKSSSPW